MKVVARIFAGVVLVVLLYVAYIAFLVWHTSVEDEARPADAIVVLGAAQYNGNPSPVLAARLDHAASLWKRGISKTIVVTGGRVPGDSHTEAGASAAYLGDKGVPDADVLREVTGRSSWESLHATALFLKQRNIHKIVLVSDSFHNARIKQMCQDLGLDPYVSATTTSPIAGSKRVEYMVREVAALGAGRIVGFDHLVVLETSFSSSN